MISVQLVTENVKPYATGLEREVVKPDAEISMMKCTSCQGILVPSEEGGDPRPNDLEVWYCDADDCDVELVDGLGATTSAYYICTSCVKNDLAEPLKFCH